MVIDLYWRVVASLWFVPALSVLAGVAIAASLFVIGPFVPDFLLNAFPKVDPEAVKDVLRLLASSTLTVATVTFSILMVVLTMTASTFSPRALTGYMRDRVNQATLGIFLGSFAFGVAALLLARVAGLEGRFFGLLVCAAVALALVVLGTLVYFIHHTATTVQITNLVLRLHGNADRGLARFLEALPAEPADAALPAAYATAPPVGVEADRVGFVQVLSIEDLRDLATSHDVVIRITRRAGDFAVRGLPLCEVWPAGRLTPALADAVRKAYAIGEQRTAESDPLLGMELLGEVAIRALSAGVNDPNTAVNCLNYLADLLVRIAGCPLFDRALCDEDGLVRVIVPSPDFRAFVERSLLGIAGAGATHLAVVMALLELIRDVYGKTVDEDRRAILRDTARAVADRALEALPFEREREQVRQAVQAVQSLVEGGASPQNSTSSS